MNIDKISIGKNPPKDVNVIIEVPIGSDPIKYEIDKESSALIVDRFLHTAMYYPCNYGFIPHTLSDDGDPVDVLTVGRRAITPGAVIAVRPIGVLLMEDDSGRDEKILAVPVPRIQPFYNSVNTYQDIPRILLDQIAHFFEHYKDLEKEKWVKVTGWESKEMAEKIILDGISAAREKTTGS
jgi:inorganic pyrophosphatase